MSKTITIAYNNKPLCDFQYKSDSTIKDIKSFLKEKYFLKIEDIIILLPNNKQLEDSTKLKTLKDPISLVKINSSFKFYQLGNELNFFPFEFDLLTTSTTDFQNKISEFFSDKMKEFNFIISKYEFFEGKKPFFDMSKPFYWHFKNQYKEVKFYFLIQDCAIHFNTKKDFDPYDIIKEEEGEEEVKKEKVEIRKNVESGKCFKIIIQTYNRVIKEMEVYPEMTIDELKSNIEKEFMVSKEHQELLYLIYKLDDGNKMIKDYYLRPQGTVFLRGFYFPLVFVDYYDKKNKNIISINIAEQVKYIREKIIIKLNLDNKYNYQLLVNGKTLEDDNYLIDFNVQRMQMIYFK